MIEKLRDLLWGILYEHVTRTAMKGKISKLFPLVVKLEGILFKDNALID